MADAAAVKILPTVPDASVADENDRLTKTNFAS